MSAKRTCILVLGMHRSGTSAVTRVLNLLGASLPNTLMPAKEENAAGFWESLAFMHVNDALLAKADSSWDDWTSFNEGKLVPVHLAALEDQILNTIKAELDGSNLIVLKDPRIARFVPFYSRILHSQGFDIRCVHMTRSPFEVAQSLETRDQFSRNFSYLLWLRHTLDAEQATRKFDRIFVTYRELMSQNSDAVKRLAEWGSSFGLSTNPVAVKRASDHLQGGLRHFDDDEEWLHDAKDALTELTARTYLAIKLLSVDTQWPESLAILDANLAELDQAAAISGPAYKDQTAKLSLLEDAHKAQAAELSAARIEIERMRKVNIEELAAHDRMRVEHALELSALHKEKETSTNALAKKLALAEREKEILRDAVTKLSINPLASLILIVHYYSARTLSRMLKNFSPEASLKYARSAAKRNPKRFMDQ